MQPIALTIAGSDPSGGAGVQADLKVFHQHQVFGTSVITLITAQNSKSVTHIALVDTDIISAQLNAVLSDVSVAAIKTGALGSAAAILCIAEQLLPQGVPLVVDPVMISSHGKLLLEQTALQTFRQHLVPRATLITPNMHEAAALAETTLTSEKEIEDAARKIASYGPLAVLIKGGHGSSVEAKDLLFYDGELRWFSSPRVATNNTHGSGCVLSAAITAELALGTSLFEAVERAKDFTYRAIATASDSDTTRYGPTNMFVSTAPRKDH